jgi:hypothetical protein
MIQSNHKISANLTVTSSVNRQVILILTVLNSQHNLAYSDIPLEALNYNALTEESPTRPTNFSFRFLVMTISDQYFSY